MDPVVKFYIYYSDFWWFSVVLGWFCTTTLHMLSMQIPQKQSNVQVTSDRNS